MTSRSLHGIPNQRGLIACTASDAHDAVRRVPQSIWNEWGENLLTEEQL